MRRLSKVGITLLTVFGLLAVTGPVFADVLVADTDGDLLIGETGSPPNDTHLVYDQVCATDGSDGVNGGNDLPVDLYVQRTQTNSAPNTYKNDSAIDLARVGSSSSAFGVEFGTAAGETEAGRLTVPSDWGDTTENPAGTNLGPVPATVRLSGVTVGPVANGDHELHVSATGTNANDGELVKELNLKIRNTRVTDENDEDGAIDCTVPTVTITTPSDEQEFTVGDVASFDFECDDDDSPNGVEASGVDPDDCVAEDGDGNSIEQGDAIDTTSEGDFSITVTATDGAGNTTSVEHDYSVVSDSAGISFNGFFSPVSVTDTNVVKAGQGVVLKWQTLDGDDLVEDNAAYHDRASVRYTDGCAGQGNDDAADHTATAGKSDLRWDADAQQYVFVWKTMKSWSGTCRTFTITYEGESLSADFYFKK